MKAADYVLIFKNYDDDSGNAINDSFVCPHCNTFSLQTFIELPNITSSYKAFFGFECVKCQEKHIYTATIDADGDRRLYKPYQIYPYDPVPSDIPTPNEDLPEEIKNDYNEAMRIVDASPRGAAALLRLCIQKLCIHLGHHNNINKAIIELQKAGLKQDVIDALNVVRVIGNEAVHPGQMDLKDDKATVSSLFSLINCIANELITEPKKIQELHASLPQKKRDEIEKRDKNSNRGVNKQ